MCYRDFINIKPEVGVFMSNQTFVQEYNAILEVLNKYNQGGEIGRAHV